MLSSMRKRTALVVLLLALAAAAAVVAQAPPRPLLSDADVKKFIVDFKPLIAELGQLGLGQEAETAPRNPGEPPGIVSVLRASAEAQKILGKYGWGDAQFQKFSAVFYSYLALKMEEQAAAQLAQVDRSSAEQKPKARTELGALAEQLAAAAASYRAQVHPDDLKTVQANEEALDAVAEE